MALNHPPLVPRLTAAQRERDALIDAIEDASLEHSRAKGARRLELEGELAELHRNLDELEGSSPQADRPKRTS